MDKSLLVLYNTWRIHFDEFYKSEKHFFLKKGVIGKGLTVLDVGCGCGGFGKALKERFGNRIDYTGINLNPKEIKIGRKKFPELKLIKGKFPDALPKNKKFDMVAAFGFFHMIVDWKRMLLDMARASKRFVNVGLLIRLNGATVVDSATSYFYYLDLNKRVPSIVQNIYELLNFCCTAEMRVKKIWFYGYHNKADSTTAFRPLPESETIYGNLFLELFQGEQPLRVGGIPKWLRKDYKIFVPEVNVIIDGKKWEREKVV